MFRKVFSGIFLTFLLDSSRPNRWKTFWRVLILLTVLSVLSA